MSRALVGAGNRGIWPILRSWALASARQRCYRFCYSFGPARSACTLNTSKTYDVSPDDQRFVMFRFGEPDEGDAELILVENWFEELKRLVPN